MIQELNFYILTGTDPKNQPKEKIMLFSLNITRESLPVLIGTGIRHYKVLIK
jgi:hypothetical protein